MLQHQRGASYAVILLFSSVTPCVIQEARRVWLDAVPVVTATWVEACAKRKAQASWRHMMLPAMTCAEVAFAAGTLAAAFLHNPSEDKRQDLRKQQWLGNCWQGFPLGYVVPAIML